MLFAVGVGKILLGLFVETFRILRFSLCNFAERVSTGTVWRCLTAGLMKEVVAEESYLLGRSPHTFFFIPKRGLSEG